MRKPRRESSEVHRENAQWQELLKQHTDIQRLWKRLALFPEQSRPWMADWAHGPDVFGTTSSSSSSSSSSTTGTTGTTTSGTTGGGGGTTSSTTSCAYDLTQVQDTFTDSDGTDLTVHTPDTDLKGGGWSIKSGSLEINGNVCETADGSAQALIDGDSGNGRLSCRVKLTDTGDISVGITFRSDAARTQYWTASINEANDEFALAGTSGSSDTKSVTINAGQWYTIEVEFCGNSIAATLDGGNDVSVSSADQKSNTYVGIGASLASPLEVASMDDFLLEV